MELWNQRRHRIRRTLTYVRELTLFYTEYRVCTDTTDLRVILPLSREHQSLIRKGKCMVFDMNINLIILVSRFFNEL